jgi:hypothetical protein
MEVFKLGNVKGPAAKGRPPGLVTGVPVESGFGRQPPRPVDLRRGTATLTRRAAIL